MRKGLPGEFEQRVALAAGGASEEELTDAWIDDCRRAKAQQVERGHILGAARDGDVVLVARLGVLSTTKEDALRFVGDLAALGTVLRDASTGRSYSVRPEAARDVADALRLAADIAEDERKAVMERARRAIRAPLGAKPSMTDDDKERARRFWLDQSLTNAEAIAKIGGGISERVLYRALGKRSRPAFGKMISKRRAKRDAT